MSCCWNDDACDRDPVRAFCGGFIVRLAAKVLLLPFLELLFFLGVAMGCVSTPASGVRVAFHFDPKNVKVLL